MRNNRNFQKIKVNGSPTTKELKKKHSSRLVGGEELGSQGRGDARQGSWQTGLSHLCVWINWGHLGNKTDHVAQVSSARKIKPQKIWL